MLITPRIPNSLVIAHFAVTCLRFGQEQDVGITSVQNSSTAILEKSSLYQRELFIKYFGCL
eukprot:2312600-Amphidinium_carterae.1